VVHLNVPNAQNHNIGGQSLLRFSDYVDPLCCVVDPSNAIARNDFDIHRFDVLLKRKCDLRVDRWQDMRHFLEDRRFQTEPIQILSNLQSDEATT
jgi:hypothetical protein